MTIPKIKERLRVYFGFQDAIAILTGVIFLGFTILNSSNHYILYLLAGTLLISVLFEKEMQRLFLINMFIGFFLSQVFILTDESNEIILNFFTLGIAIGEINISVFLLFSLGTILVNLVLEISIRKKLSSEHIKTDKLAGMNFLFLFLITFLTSIIIALSTQIRVFSYLTLIADEQMSEFHRKIDLLLTIYGLFTIFITFSYDLFIIASYLSLGFYYLMEKIIKKSKALIISKSKLEIKSESKSKSKQKITIKNQQKGL